MADVERWSNALPPSKPRILIADDHYFVAEGYQRLLEPEFDIVGIVTSGRDLITRALSLKPDLVLVDIGMPALNGLDAASRLKVLLPRTQIIYVTMTADPELALAAFERGGAGFVLKTCAISELVVALQTALRGGTYVCSLLKQRVEELRWAGTTPLPESDRLTARQREVLQMIAEGSSVKEVAATLGISARTVTYHKYRMMEILGVKNSAELVRYAARHHMV